MPSVNMVMMWDSKVSKYYSTDILNWLYPDDIVIEIEREGKDSYILTTTGLVGWVASEFLKKI